MIEIALEYIARDWSPIPIPHKRKKPIGEEWPRWRIAKDSGKKGADSLDAFSFLGRLDTATNIEP